MKSTKESSKMVDMSVVESARSRSLVGTAKEPFTTTTSSSSHEISFGQKMLSACSGSFLTSLIVTPFDVVRVRIQQQQILPNDSPCCSKHFPELKQNFNAAANIPKGTSPELFWITQNYCKNAESCTRITSTFQGLATIGRTEGLRTLWRGLSLTLVMAVPSNIIYFTGYEYIRDHSPLGSNPLNPLLCGSLARTLSASIITPFELIKTRLQSIPVDSKSSPKMLTNLLKDTFNLVRLRGVGTLFTGLQITLWRDVPFSGIYWFSYEAVKQKVTNLLDLSPSHYFSQTEEHKVLLSSFVGGSVSGLIAAFATHPFDVGKTRLQITSQDQNIAGKAVHRSMFKYLFDIYRVEGINALYAGFIPRALKIAPACAIMISSYEIAKKLFKNGNIKQNDLQS